MCGKINQRSNPVLSHPRIGECSLLQKIVLLFRFSLPPPFSLIRLPVRLVFSSSLAPALSFWRRGLGSRFLSLSIPPCRGLRSLSTCHGAPAHFVKRAKIERPWSRGEEWRLVIWASTLRVVVVKRRGRDVGEKRVCMLFYHPLITPLFSPLRNAPSRLRLRLDSALSVTDNVAVFGASRVSTTYQNSAVGGVWRQYNAAQRRSANLH